MCVHICIHIHLSLLESKFSLREINEKNGSLSFSCTVKVSMGDANAVL